MKNQFENPIIQENISEDEYYEDFRNEVKEVVKKDFELDNGEIEEEIRKYFDDYGNRLADLLFLSEKTGKYFRKLRVSSFSKNDKDYSHKREINHIDFGTEKAFLLKKLNIEINPSIFKDNFNSGVFEKEHESGKTQEGYFFRLRNNGKIAAEQLIDNYLSEQNNIPSTKLVITDLETKKQLNINSLLPKETSIAPSEMFDIREEIDEQNNRIIMRPYPKDLKDYSGNSDSINQFASYKTGEEKIDVVLYGDIQKKGGMLTLLHEIAHSWQHAYSSKYGKGKFEELHFKAEANFIFLEKYLTLFKQNKINENKLEAAKMVVEDRLKDFDIKFEINNFIYNGQNLGENDIVIKTDEREYIVQCKNLKSILELYEKNERDAWAHAILVLRFLRKNGIDLEPDMKKLEDFQQFIDPCLQSYQKSVENKIKFSNGKVGFSRRNEK